MVVPDILIFVAALAGLILGHELGHFVAARLSGVRIDEFGIGFPPRIATLFVAGGTRYSINAIPLGGFVRPAGEDDPTVPNGLAGARKLVRAFVLISGPGANFLLAIVAFTAAYKFAAPDFERVLITGVEPNSPALAAGIQPGDIILAVDDVPVDGFETLQGAITARLGMETVLHLERDGQSLSVRLVPRREPPEGQGPVGVTLGNPPKQVSWPQAYSMGVGSLRLQVSELMHLPGRLLRGEVPQDQARLVGIKGMYDMMAWAGEIDRSAQRPFLTLNLIGIISAGLGLANLMPIPAFDGGRLLFVAIEAVFRRRVSPRHEGLAHAIGFAFLLALMLYVNFQDFVNPINLPP